MLITKAVLNKLCMLLAAGGIGAGGVILPKAREAAARPTPVRAVARPAARQVFARTALPWMAPAVAAPLAVQEVDCVPLLQTVAIENGSAQLLEGVPESRVPMRDGDRFVLPGTPVWGGGAPAPAPVPLTSL